MAKQFIKLPEIMDFKNIKYRDILVYLTIKSFDNPQKNIYPSLRIIAKNSGLSYKFVSESIFRLEASKLITIEHGTKSYNNHYAFTDKATDSFIMIPRTLLEYELTPEEKSILLCVRLFCYDTFETLETGKSIAEKLNIPYPTFSRQITNLKRKGYISSKVKITSHGERIQIIRLEKFNWAVNVEIQNEEKPTFVNFSLLKVG